ncbi:MAG: hypothetical protein AAGC43_18540, partial [Bacteroidota bacterium]
MEWTNGGDQVWININSVKLGNPVLLIHFAQEYNLLQKKGFKWITPFCNSKDITKSANLVTIFKAGTQPQEKRFKFGIQVPRGTKDAFLLDTRNNNKLWEVAIGKELQQLNDMETFRPLAEGEEPPKDYKRVPYHIV